MSRLMYDTVDVSKFPGNGYAYAGYVNGSWPTYKAMVQEFPHRKHVAIDVLDGQYPFEDLTPNAVVLDVERGDANPVDAPGWVHRQRSGGWSRVTVYCSLSTWSAVVQAFRTQQVELPDFWIAHYTGVSHQEHYGELTAVAVQWKNTFAYDVSTIFDPYWPDIAPE